jgi:hypothetical protein
MRSAMEEKWACVDLFCLRLLMLFSFLKKFFSATRNRICTSCVQVRLVVFWTLF